MRTSLLPRDSTSTLTLLTRLLLAAFVAGLSFLAAITVQFTILQDGSLGEVSLVESSGATLLDLAAKRAIYSAAPFGPLPRSYGKTSYTIQAVFKPAS